MTNENSLRLYTEAHAEKQRYMHDSQKTWLWGKNTEYFFPWFNETPIGLNKIIKELDPTSVLDYGCGQGYAMDNLAKQFPNIAFYNYDPFIEKNSTYPTVPCDLLISNNVLHHVETEFYDQLVANLYSLCQNIALFKIYCHDGYRSIEWYIEQFNKLFQIDSFVIGEPLTTEPEKTMIFLSGQSASTKTPLYLRLSK
jgi:2-polyprenyl-3-methyl-5-hydroxy-6-metoxy-1,4-benzoquinol methylase